MNKWVKYLAWLLGMFILLYIVLHVETAVYKTANETYSMTSEVWIVSLISCIMGVYLSFLFISCKPCFNASLFFCVFIPSLALGFYYPLSFFIPGLHVPPWMPVFDHHGLVHIVSGLSLAMSLLNGRK
jgi:uncharacterized membrane protein